ncbi:modification methylase Sau96I [Streptococcus iniae]|uniref:modification methylase Sau96I n=1 Tax=Streptococcus iniae TaxID=1346 RepID=UPI0016053E73|nr:modification methylase Sau96I [Streptococcus iniae]
MKKNGLYEQLINSEPMGFIDPLTDLGEFDIFQMKFKEPVRHLKNKYSGKPYSLQWQSKIEDMRSLFIKYQKSLREDVKEEIVITSRARNHENKEYLNEIVTTYLKLGFKFPEIEKRVSLSVKRLRNQWNRRDYISSHKLVIYHKDDLRVGHKEIKENLPRNLGVQFK